MRSFSWAPHWQLAAVALFFLAAPSSAHAWCQSLSVAGGSTSCRQTCLTLEDFTPAEREARSIVPLRWERRCIEYAIHQDGSSDLSRDAVERVIAGAFAKWTTVDCGGTPVDMMVRPSSDPAECAVPEYVSGGANANSFVFVDDWSERGHAGGAFALTTTWFSTRSGEIFDADMELNQQFWTWAECPDAGCEDGRVDLDNTVTHELGHVFGLAHTPDDREATMWACADEGETFKRTLADDDTAGLCSIYPPGSLPPECDYDPRGGFDPACRAERSGCGCSVPGSGDTPTALWGIALLLAGLLVRRATRG